MHPINPKPNKGHPPVYRDPPHPNRRELEELYLKTHAQKPEKPKTGGNKLMRLFFVAAPVVVAITLGAAFIYGEDLTIFLQSLGVIYLATLTWKVFDEAE